MRALRRSARMLGAVVVAGAVFATSPASAVTLVQFTSPNPGQVVAVSNPTIAADITSADGSITGDVTLTVDWTEGQEPVVSRTVTGNGGSSQSVSFSVALAYNGSYLARITTDGQAMPAEQQFFVAAPPAAPSGVKAGLVPASAKVAVSWNRNPEPDIVGYRVERSAGDGPFSPVGTTKETTLVDPGAPVVNGGYRVVALRRGARPGEEVASAPSSRVAPGAGGGGRGGPPARLGIANLSKFDKLLADAKAQGAPAGAAEPAEDGTFDPNLPYGGSAEEAELGREELGREEQPGPGGATLPYVAGGLLALDAFLLLRSIRAQVRLPLAA